MTVRPVLSSLLGMNTCIWARHAVVWFTSCRAMHVASVKWDREWSLVPTPVSIMWTHSMEERVSFIHSTSCMCEEPRSRHLLFTIHTKDQVPGTQCPYTIDHGPCCKRPLPFTSFLSLYSPSLMLLLLYWDKVFYPEYDPFKRSKQQSSDLKPVSDFLYLAGSQIDDIDVLIIYSLGLKIISKIKNTVPCGIANSSSSKFSNHQRNLQVILNII